MDIKSTKSLGHAVRLLRKKAGLSQSDLALRTNLSRTAIQNLEGGKPTLKLSTLFPILDYLNATLSLNHSVLGDENIP